MYKNAYDGREHGKKQWLNEGQCDPKKRKLKKPKIQVQDEAGNIGKVETMYGLEGPVKGNGMSLKIFKQCGDTKKCMF